jgi:hypothetical protein
MLLQEQNKEDEIAGRRKGQQVHLRRLSGDLKESIYVGELGINGRTIIKLILDK